MLDNRVFALGWSMGRREEVPSWRPYEDERPNPERVVESDKSAEQIELPFEI